MRSDGRRWAQPPALDLGIPDYFDELLERIRDPPDEALRMQTTYRAVLKGDRLEWRGAAGGRRW